MSQHMPSEIPSQVLSSSVSSPLDGFAYRTTNPFTRLRASVITCLPKMCLREWFVKLALERNRAAPPRFSPSLLGWDFGSKLVAFGGDWAVLADSTDS